jgi:Ca-activated chloride channel family protein
MLSVPVLAASPRQLVVKGNALFSAGEYDKALDAYKEAEVNAPESPYLYFNTGAALYKQGEYAAAREAFQQAALKSQDLNLEAESKFNLGLCAVRESERQQDSDLQKALDAYGQSIQFFREALDLKPDFHEAAENIEVVRLMMKSILDEIKKREEEAQNQQEQMRQATEQLKTLIQRQQDLIARNNEITQKSGQIGQPDNTDMQNLADAQGTLQHDTQQLSETLANQSQSPVQNAQRAEPEAVTHLNDSVQEQGLAVQQFKDNQSQPAGEHQQKSLEALLKAQESFTKQQQGQQGQQQQQQGQQGQQQQQSQTGQKNKSDQEQGQTGTEQDQPQEENQQAALTQLPDNADSILDEERQNNMRRTYGNMPGGYSEVDKDW